MTPSLSAPIAHTPTRPPWAFAPVITYGLVHAVIDATTVTTLYRAGRVSGLVKILSLVITYNLLAFALQAVLGPIVDLLRAPRASGIVGSLLALAAFLSIGHGPAFVTVAAAGVGNALFHLGGGVIALSVAPGRSAPSGVFVAPGALGLALGVWLGRHPEVTAAPLLIPLVAGMVAQALVRIPIPATPVPRRPQNQWLPPLARATALAALSLLLLTVLVRSVVGGGAPHALAKSLPLSLSLAGAAFLGKLCGGFVADRFGWLRASVVALLVSLPLLVVGERQAWAVVIGIMVFQTTMPVTVAAASVLLPGRPATAFGLCCLALVLGAAVFWDPPLAKAIPQGAVFAILILLSAFGVGYGLRLLGSRVPSSTPLDPAEEDPHRLPCRFEGCGWQDHGLQHAGRGQVCGRDADRNCG